MMGIFLRCKNKLKLILAYIIGKCTYVHACLSMFCDKFLFLLCALGTPWANYSAAFPKKVQ